MIKMWHLDNKLIIKQEELQKLPKTIDHHSLTTEKTTSTDSDQTASK